MERRVILRETKTKINRNKIEQVQNYKMCYEKDTDVKGEKERVACSSDTL